MNDQSAAVIIPTTGRASLRRAVESVLDQTHENTVAFVVVDGAKHANDAIDQLMGHFKNPRLQFMALPQNTGANGYQGHRIYGAMPLLLNQDWIFYLDDDNWFEPDHVAECVNTCVEHNLDWCGTLRNVIGEDGKLICVDECESLAVLPTWFDAGMVHLDTSSYCLSRAVAIQLAQHWHRPHLPFESDPSVSVSPDAAICNVLRADAPRFALIAKPTVNYVLGSRDITPKPEFFLRGNAEIRKRYGGRLPWESVENWPKTKRAAGWTSSVERWDQFLVSLESFRRYHTGDDLACYLLFLSDPERLAEVEIPDGLRVLTWNDFDPQYRERLFLENGVMAGFPRCLLVRRMQQFGHERILMLDADMEFFGPLDDMFETLGTHDAIVTPHRLTPTPADGKRMGMESFALFGNYNAGFSGWSNRPAANEFVKWWLDISVDAPEQAPQNGRYAEQGWLRFVGDFVDKVHVCRDPGVNAAWWRLDMPEQIKRGSNGWLIDGVPLKLFHFSQIDFDDIGIVTKWQDRVRGSGDLLALYAEYRDKVKKRQRSIVPEEPTGIEHADAGTSD